MAKRERLEISSGKLENIKGPSHPKMGVIKHKNGRDPVDAEEIKKRWKQYKEELYLKRY